MMKRNKPMNRGTSTLTRSPFKPKAPANTRAPRKAKRKREGHAPRYLEACRGEPCYLILPGICRQIWPDETVVPAHQNEGKGTGLKVPDQFTVPACFLCHTEFDQGNIFTREQKRGFFTGAYAKWLLVRNRKLSEVTP